MRSRIAGFSLVELMVAVGIIGILAVIAVPRYKSFLVQARRGEAKSNLSHLATLQEVYKAEHYVYYQGAAMTDPEGVGYKDGRGNVGDCTDPSADIDKGLGNYLGFRPNGCSELRYFYQFAGGNAIASAASDADARHIYPDCNGYATCVECGYRYGDALTMPMGGEIKVCRNITKYCPDAGAGCVTTLDPPLCPATTTCATGETLHTSPPCCRADPDPICSCPSTIIVGTTWTPTTASLDLNNKYTCQQFSQHKTNTKTYMVSSPECAAAGHTCPAAETITGDERTVAGTKPPDCLIAPGEVMAACPCVDGDTRSCCTTSPCTYRSGPTFVADGTLLNSAGVRLDDIYDCQETLEMGNDITTYYELHCPNSSVPAVKPVCGQFAVRCVDACTDGTKYVDWETCEDVTSQTVSIEVGGVCKRKGKMSLTCNSPCAADLASSCTSALDLTDCAQERSLELSERPNCPCPKICSGGDYNNEEVYAAKRLCEGKGASWSFVGTDEDDDGQYDCKCSIKVVGGNCIDGDGNMRTVRNCREYETWHGSPVCDCLKGPSYLAPSGEYSFTFYPRCIQPHTDLNLAALSSLFTESGFDSTSDSNIFLTPDAAKWGNVLQKITCGDSNWNGEGATGYASYAEVQTLRGLLRNWDLDCENPSTTITVTYTCGGGG